MTLKENSIPEYPLIKFILYPTQTTIDTNQILPINVDHIFGYYIGMNT